MELDKVLTEISNLDIYNDIWLDETNLLLLGFIRGYKKFVTVIYKIHDGIPYCHILLYEGSFLLAKERFYEEADKILFEKAGK